MELDLEEEKKKLALKKSRIEAKEKRLKEKSVNEGDFQKAILVFLREFDM